MVDDLAPYGPCKGEPLVRLQQVGSAAREPDQPQLLGVDAHVGNVQVAHVDGDAVGGTKAAAAAAAAAAAGFRVTA